MKYLRVHDRILAIQVWDKTKAEEKISQQEKRLADETDVEKKNRLEKDINSLKKLVVKL